MKKNTLLLMMLTASVLSGAIDAASQQTEPGRRLEVEILALRPHGFEPVELRRPAGPFLLHVTNRTGLEEIVLELHRSENGVRRVRLMEQRTKRGHLRWTSLLDLSPGEYTLSGISGTSGMTHPEWVFRLVITAGER